MEQCFKKSTIDTPNQVSPRNVDLKELFVSDLLQGGCISSFPLM